MTALGHGCVGSNDLGKANAFYDALLWPAGVTPLFEQTNVNDGLPYLIVNPPGEELKQSVSFPRMREPSQRASAR